MHPDYPIYVQPLLKNDRAGTQRIYNEMRKPTISYLVGKGCDVATAEDVFQDALVVVWNMAQKPSFLLSTPFRALLWGVALRLWWNKATKKSSAQEITTDEFIKYEGIEAACAGHFDQETYFLFHEKLQNLPARCIEVIKNVFDDLPFATIANTLNFTNDNAARQHYFQCKQKLTKLIQTDSRYSELMV